MNRAWIISAALAIGTHAALLFTVYPDTRAQPRTLAGESSAVELSVVETAPPEPAPAAPPPPEPVPAPPEPIPEPVRQPSPAPAILKPVPPLRVRSEIPKSRVVVPPRTASAFAQPSRGSVSGATPGPSVATGPSTTARPRYRSNPKPDYPPEARRASQQGTVLISVEVTAEGRAASVQLARSSGFPLLDTAALQAVRRWTFEPGRTAGLPITSRVEVPVRFDLRR